MTDLPMPWIKTLEGTRPSTLEYRDMTTYEFVEEISKSKPNETNLIFGVKGGKTLTYAQTFDSIKRLAVRLVELGVKKGDRVLLLLGNTPHYVIGHYAILSIGAVVVQGNPIYTIPELTHQVNDSGAKGVITISLFQDKVNSIMGSTSLEFAIIGNVGDYMSSLIAFIGKLTKKLDDPKFKKLPNNYYFSDYLAKSDISKFKKVVVDMEDLAILQYTGGTTGAAKGAMLTHKNISYNAQQARSLIHKIPKGEGSMLTVLPLFHSFGLTVCLGNAYQSEFPMVLVPRFNPADALMLIEKYRITFLAAVPAMLIAILNHPDFAKTDLSSLIASISGGAALPVEVAKTFGKASGADIVEGYGLSETSPIVVANPVKSEVLKPRIGSIGLPATDTMVKIVDTDDYSKDLPIGEAGEICLKGHQIMKGYWNNPEDTKKVLHDDGWFQSGDIGKMDEEGFFYIVDRKKDLIIVSGNNVVPREVEEVLYAHEAILEAACVGKPDDKKGEVVAIYVVLKDGHSVTKEELIKYCADNLAAYKIPKHVEFRDSLPKTMIGKILRRKLKEEQ